MWASVTVPVFATFFRLPLLASYCLDVTKMRTTTKGLPLFSKKAAMRQGQKVRKRFVINIKIEIIVLKSLYNVIRTIIGLEPITVTTVCRKQMAIEKQVPYVARSPYIPSRLYTYIL